MARLADAADVDLVRPLAAQEFEQIRQLAYRTFGLDLKAGKEELVSARLRKLVRGGGHRTFQDYYKSIIGDRSGASLLAMVDALATNHTSFMREADHFQFLRDQVIQGWERDPIEVWSAACSTGRSMDLAMVLNDAMPNRRVRIAASGISTRRWVSRNVRSIP
jgi:chemotaxis protein methyltransferase CheR